MEHNYCVSAGPAPHILHCKAVLIADATNIFFCNYGKNLCTLGGYKMYVEVATAFIFLCKRWTHDPWNPSQRGESYSSNPERPVINEAAETSLKIHTNLLTRCRPYTYARTSKICNQNTATTFYTPLLPTTSVTYTAWPIFVASVSNINLQTKATVWTSWLHRASMISNTLLSN